MTLIETLASKLRRIALGKQGSLKGIRPNELSLVQDQVLRACELEAMGAAREGVTSVEVCLFEEDAESPKCLKHIDYSKVAAVLRREGFTVYSCGYVRGGLSGPRGNSAFVAFSL